jgi:hypothetical protein
MSLRLYAVGQAAQDEVLAIFTFALDFRSYSALTQALQGVEQPDQGTLRHFVTTSGSSTG